MLLMGAAFPVGLRYCTAATARSHATIGFRVGSFYLVNLAGSIVGATVAGFLLIPRLGTRGALLATTAVGFVAALALLFVVQRPARWRLSAAVPAVAAFCGLATVLPDPLDVVLDRRYPDERVLWRAEAPQSTVSVHERDGQRILYLDGLHQANDSTAMAAVHRQIGTVPMMLHHDPQRVLVIGLGGGITPGSVALFTRPRIDVVELSAGVVGAAGWFRHVNNDVLRRPNVRLRIDDGRNHLLIARDRYDVITADIIQPFHAGAGNLYSREYFALAAKALDEEGIMLQWVGTRPTSQYQMIARTFQSVFPETTAWAGGTLLVGKRTPLRLSASHYQDRARDPDFSRALAWSGLAGFEDLVGQFTAGPADLRAFVGDGPILTDDRPLVEFFRELPQNEPDIDLSELHGSIEPHLVP
jgi:spermidine synthase